MQTFLPYPNMIKSLECLDFRRLGKQRVEAMQILNALAGQSRGWVNHPCTRMWRGHEHALMYYMDLAIETWINRGYNNNMMYSGVRMEDVVMPSWFGDDAFHNSHKSNLLSKDPDHYGQFKWQVPSNLEYVWPK